MMWFRYPYGGGGWIFMVIVGVLTLLFFIALMVWIVRGRQAHLGTHSMGETPEEILKKRYAKGEITQKEYKEMLSEIRK